MITKLRKLTDEELKEKIEFARGAGGPHGMRLVKNCELVLRERRQQ